MKEKLAPFLAIAAAACAGQQVTKSPEPKVEEAQCNTAGEALRAIGAKKVELQPDGTYVDYVTSEDVTPNLAQRGAVLKAQRGAIRTVCGDVARAKGCRTGKETISPNKMRPFDIEIECPDVSRNSSCSTTVEVIDYGHCATPETGFYYPARVKADPKMVIENPPFTPAVEVE